MLADDSTVSPEVRPQAAGRRGAGVSIFVTAEAVDDVAERSPANGIDVGDARATRRGTRRSCRWTIRSGTLVFSEGPLDEDASFDEVVGSTGPGG